LIKLARSKKAELDRWPDILIKMAVAALERTQSTLDQARQVERTELDRWPDILIKMAVAALERTQSTLDQARQVEKGGQPATAATL
jgi:hypothetical protein